MGGILTLMDYQAHVKQLVEGFWGRRLSAEDGVGKDQIRSIERILGFRLPPALRAYYLVAGNLDELNRVHNELCWIESVSIQDQYLVFMHENQYVVSWGIAVSDLDQADPVVWQRNNTPPEEWFSEEATFLDFMQRMFEWYKKMSIL
jgi:hypothetical protein